jgi:rubrerythrin
MRTQRRRLAGVFQAALLAVGSPAIMIACSSSGGSSTRESDDAGALDATLDSSVPQTDDAALGEAGGGKPDAADAAKPTPPVEAGSGGCFAGSYELDAGPDSNPDADVCAYTYACGLTGTGLGTVGCQVLQVTLDGGLVPFSNMTCWLAEDAGCLDDALAPDNEAGGVTVFCAGSCGGRRPVGLRAPRTSPAATKLGAYLARMAFEEDASIAAFERMRLELAALGAPATLTKGAARAAQEERRHARTMTKLASARGAVVAKARVRRARKRSAAAVAAENAAEGCVRETYGALVALWQSLHAEDVELRRAFARIAEEEASHAALSWAVARWIEPRLGEAARRRVARARSRALRALEDGIAIEPAADVARSVGLPRAATARVLLSVMTRELGLGADAR